MKQIIKFLTNNEREILSGNSLFTGELIKRFKLLLSRSNNEQINLNGEKTKNKKIF